jgi:hypothetical protein
LLSFPVSQHPTAQQNTQGAYLFNRYPGFPLSTRRDIYHDTLFNLQFSFLSFEFGFRMGGSSKAAAAAFSGWMDGRIALICLEEVGGRF